MNAVSTTVPLRVDLQIAAGEPAVPDEADWEAWVHAALAAGESAASGVVTVRLVTEDESATLNLSYRDKPGATNVLAFPGDDSMILPLDVAGEAAVEAELGDLVICLPVAYREADEQGKRPVAHLAHLVVHGTLHLIGYDHTLKDDAERMENLEVRILSGLGFADPYGDPENMSDSRHE